MLQREIRIIFWNYMVLCHSAIIPIHRQGKLSLIEWTNYNYREPEGYGTYAFGYDVEDPETNNVQFRNEEKLSNGSVIGSYGYLESSGNAFVVNYIADHNGYRAFVDDSRKLKDSKTVLRTPFRQQIVKNTSNTDMNNVILPNVKKDEKLINTSHKKGSKAQQDVDKKVRNKTEQKNNTFHFNTNDLNEFYSGEIENEQKRVNFIRNQYPFLNFSKEIGNNFLYSPQNTLKNQNFLEEQGETVLQKKKFRRKKETILRRKLHPMENSLEGELEIPALLGKIIQEQTNEITSRDNELSPKSKAESKIFDKNNTTLNSSNFRRHLLYFPNVVSISDERKNEESNVFQQEPIMKVEQGSFIEKKKKIQNEEIMKENSKHGRILAGDVIPSSPAPMGPPCINSQNSNKKHWPKSDKFVNSNIQLQGQIYDTTLTRPTSTGGHKKQVENAKLENKFKLLRIVTPDKNVSEFSFRPISC